MRLGVTGMIPGDFNVDDKLARRIVELGFTGVGAHWTQPLDALTPAVRQRFLAALEQQGLQLVQFWGLYPSIISPDEQVRQTGVRTVREIVKIGAELGAAMVGVRPTSLNPRGDWWPHPDNYAPETEDRLVRSLRDIAAACEIHGIPIALECHVTTTLNSAEGVRRIVERTESTWVKVNMDPVNYVRDLHAAYHTTELIHHLFDVLGPYVASAHIKDLYLEDRLVVHISETVPGTGILDFDTFFRRFEALLPDGYAIVEHLPESLIPQAAAFVIQKLADLNITIRR
jgi:sugar phosphate isomerase/epimerase